MSPRSGADRSGSRPGRLHSADGTVPPVRSTSFDVRAFTRSAFGDRVRGPDDVAPDDMAPALRWALVHLWEIERSATDTLRRVLATSTSREARYTAFLTTWAHDKYWFADHLRRALGPAAPSANRVRRIGTSARDRRGRALDVLTQRANPVWTTLVGEPTTALHATRGLAAESAELAATTRIGELAGGRLDDVLAPVLERKAEHHAFFLAEARMRLDDDPVGRRLVRRLLTAGFHPLRPGGLPVTDSHRFLRLLFVDGARDRVVGAADRDVLGLPGVRGAGPLERALRRERPAVPPARPGEVHRPDGDGHQPLRG